MKIKGQKVKVQFNNYLNNDRVEIELICDDDEYRGEPYCSATINVPEEHLEEDEVVIKTYSESQGVLEFLIENKIIHKPHRTVQVSEFVRYAPVCKLIPQEMIAIDRIIDFAEQISIEDNAKMKKLDAWEKHIKPLFKNHTGYNFDLSYVSMYRKEWKEWLDVKFKEFEKDYCA